MSYEKFQRYPFAVRFSNFPFAIACTNMKEVSAEAERFGVANLLYIAEFHST